MAEMLKIRNERAAKGDKEIAEYLNTGNGIGVLFFQVPNDKNLVPSLVGKSMALLLALGVVVILMALVGMAAVVHVWTLIDVLQHPTFSPTITKAIVSYVIVVDVVIFFWVTFQHGLVPFKSHERLNRLHELSFRDPERYAEIIAQSVRKHRSRGFLWRVLMKPRIRS